MCGEKDRLQPPVPFLLGSPPRVRGEVCRLARLQHDRGITPACAGRSSKKLGVRGIREDHPRVCGEKVYLEQKNSGR